MKKSRAYVATVFFVIAAAIACGGAVRAENATDTPCLTCHEKVAAPAKHVHKPLMDCGTCHKPIESKNHPTDKKSMKLTQNIPGLCTSCHKNIKPTSAHASMCTNCHDAHRSDFSKLLRSDAKDVCYLCHDENAFRKKYVHGILPVGGCTACHNPHSGKRSLIDKDANSLCLDCHKAKASGRHIVTLPGRKIHPVMGVKDPSTLKWIKAPDPKNPGKELPVLIPDPSVPVRVMGCMSCHDPHSSDYKKLFPVEKICSKCHPQY